MALEAAAPSGEVGRVKTTRIVSSHVSVPQRIIEIWRSRQLLLNLIRTEIRIKYKNSVLGLLWSLLSPAMALLVYTLVFSVALKNGIPEFVILLFSGLLAWNLFQTSVLSATGVIVNNAGLVKKVSFPREILALASVGSASVFFFFQTCVMVLFLVVLHWRPAFADLWLLLVALVPLVVFVAAISLFLAAVNVYLRDTQHLVEVVVGAAWFWACPIVYSFQQKVYPALKGHHILWLYFLNPLTPIVLTFQRVIYARTGLVQLTTKVAKGTAPLKAQLLPGWGNWTYVQMDLIVLGVSIVLLYLAMVVFGRLAGNFAEEL
jgi:ABC-2 type transport system permease protein